MVTDSLRRRCKVLAGAVIRWAAWVAGKGLPLSARQALVRFVGRHNLPGGFEFAMGMLDDLRRRNPDALHRFLWSNHLAYAVTYEIPKRFGASNLNPSRRILFNDMVGHLRSRGLDPCKDIRSIFDVGCSMGYLLRHLETEVFLSATTLHGLDIDTYSIEAGTAHLSSVQSKVKLFAADMTHTDRIMGNQTYDVVLCCGVLMYVNDDTAEQVVRTMFSHAGHLVAMVCLAPPESQIALGRSVTRASDGAFIHDMDGLIQLAGGQVISKRWIGASGSVANPSYAILAEPPRQPGL